MVDAYKYNKNKYLKYTHVAHVSMIAKIQDGSQYETQTHSEVILML